MPLRQPGLGSLVLRTLALNMPTLEDIEKLRSINPHLRRLTTGHALLIDPQTHGTFFSVTLIEVSYVT
jgi:hypothetical protein